VLHVAELARQYERSDGLSFRGFVEALRTAAERGEAAEAPIVEEGSEGVRLMTVHKAKGLEFPVVILVDPTAKIAQIDPGRHIDSTAGRCALRIGGWSPKDLLDHQAIEHARDVAEGIRLAYVAATRARDLLVVPAVGDEPYDSGWVSPLNRAVYPPVGERRTPAAAQGCPPFRRDSVLERPDDGVALPTTVSPGCYRVGPDDGGTEIVWWDPGALVLDVEPAVGLRREELIAKDVAPEVVEAGLQRHGDWSRLRAEAGAAGRTPWLSVMTTTEWASSDLPDTGSRRVEIVTLPAGAGRPSGPRFGTLVHAALATVRIGAEDGELGTAVATQGRIVGATPDEVLAAQAAVAHALAHPLLGDARRAAGEGRCHREVPVTLREQGHLIEGVVDLAFEIDGRFTVVDFKTDRADEQQRAKYVRQVSLYAEAIARATGAAVRAVLLEV